MVPLLLLAVIATAPTRIVLNAGSFSCGGFVVAETMETSPPAVVRAQLDAANAASVVLDPTSDWRISLNESRCWATPAYLLKTDGSRDQIAIQTWPARQLKGRSSVQAAALTVTLQSPQAAEDVIPLREKVVQDCRVDGLRWQCTVPATMIDARLAATGFAPVYLWNRDLRKNDLDVGTVKLERGASVIGWITNPDGESAADAEVVLRPSAMAETAGLTQQFDAQVLKVTTTAQGFFQIQAVPPGTYSLTARAVGMSPERVEDIRITEPNEYAIDEIHLATLGRLSLSITPAATPKGGLWQVKLRPLTKIDTPPAKFEPRPANDDGQWNQGGLERGTYRVLVYDDAGARVAEREVIMQSDLETVQITVDAIPVEGRVRVGSKPVPGKLRFETDGAKVEIETDANGEFTGSLPNEGTWRVQVTPTAARQRLRVQKVTVEREDGGATARVDIDLPGGVIEGIVVDSLGKGVPDAEVIVRRGTLLEANGATDETGHFRLFGLREGEVAVLAVKRGVQSDELKQVVAKNATPVTLELRETGNITGRIVRMDGSPVTGAVVRYLYGTRAPDPAISGPTGYFSLKLPQNAQSVIVVVIAEGLPVKLEQMRLPKDGNGFEIRMTGVGGTLLVRSGESSPELPVVHRETARITMGWLFAPRPFGPPAEMQSDGFHLHLEAGPYTLCLRDQCINAIVTPNGKTSADFRNGSQGN